jgi:hypothetical protein
LVWVLEDGVGVDALYGLHVSSAEGEDPAALNTDFGFDSSIWEDAAVSHLICGEWVRDGHAELAGDFGNVREDGHEHGV